MANPQPDQFLKFSTELWWAWTKFQMPAYVAKVCQVVIGMTYGFNRNEAEISLQQFQRLTGIKDRSNLGRAQRKAIKMNLVVRRDHRGKVTYRFQKDYEKWLPWSVETTVVQRDHDRGPTRPWGSGKPLPGKTQISKKNPIDKYIDNKTTGLSDRAAVEVYFMKLHNENWGERYPINFPRDRKILNTLLKIHSLDNLFAMVDRLLYLVQGGDKFYGEFSIPKLSQHQTKLLQDISKPLVPELPSWNDAQLAALDRVKGNKASAEDRALVKKVYAQINAYEKWRERQ